MLRILSRVLLLTALFPVIGYCGDSMANVKAGEFKLIYNPSTGEKEQWYVNDHCFIKGPDGMWHLFGITHQEPMAPIDEDNFAHAVSPNLTSGWEKKPFALKVDESKGESHLWAPHVIYHNGLYYMYYCGGSNEGNNKYKINLATSKNLYDWERHPANPMVVDGYDARDPFILKQKDGWIMYYTATSEPNGGNHIVAAVTSKDLIHWSDKKVVFTDPSVGTYGGPTESPTVIQRGKCYYLFIGPRDDYRGTCVYRSKNPFEFKIENLVGKINSHAAEVVRDDNGDWYVSHCGWGQGGVYLAPLQWNDGLDDNDTSLPIAPLSVGEFKNIYNPATPEKKWWINDHSIMRGKDGVWHFWGITDEMPANEEPNPMGIYFAHATASKLTQSPWNREPFTMKADKALNETHLWAPHIIEYNDLYYMFYCGGNPDHSKYQINLATSTDLVNWKRHPANPMVVDGFDARDPFVLRLKDKWVMYYTATSKPESGNHTVEAVTSKDLVHWSNKTRVYTDEGTGTFGGNTESPFVVRRGNYYYLFIGPGASYVTTKVFRSTDPFKWTADDEVATVTAHASEIVRDVDGKWYITHCGVERGGLWLAPLAWHDGVSDNDTSIPPAGEVRKISRQVYRDKMIGAWIGQMAGVTWGAPTEFKWLGKTIPDENVPEWKPEMIEGAFWQDDLYVEMTFLKTIEDYGFDVSYKQAGIDFANSKYELWHANLEGRNNLRKGIAPPDSGHPKFNSHADDIDYQIEADYAGLISPGMPGFAVELGDKFGRIMNYGDGLYGGQFVSAMYSIAYFENDIEKIIKEALTYIPADSEYAQAVNDTINWYKQYPNDWRKTWNLLDEKYQKDKNFRKFSCGDKGDFNIDAKINGAYVVIGLLYGKGNIENTIKIAMQCGQDSDCNPSSAAGILFTTIGYSKLPDKYKAADQNKKFAFTAYSLPELYKVCEKFTENAIIRNGGSVDKDTFTIPVMAARSEKLEKCDAPGEISNSKYSQEELKSISVEKK
jgi:beta-xylosidase